MRPRRVLKKIRLASMVETQVAWVMFLWGTEYLGPDWA